jgi:hypothetical protein
MPPLLIPVFAAAASAVGITASAGAIAIAANVAFTALSIGANFALQSAEARKQKKAQRRNSLNGAGGQAVQQTVRLSVGPRLRHYGRVKAGGALVFIETKSGVIHQLLVFNSGTITEYEEFFVGGKPVLIDADGAVTQPPYYQGAFADPNLRSLVRIESRRGYADQPASAVLMAAYPGDWTADHQLKGLAYGVLACRQVAADRHQTVYNGQIPALSAIFRAVAVFDPRDVAQSAATPDSWQWSDNPALCLLDYMTVGMGIGRSAFDVESFAAAASHFDEPVARKGAGTEKRYRLSGGYSFDEDPAQVCQRMLDTCRGQLHLTSAGLIGLRTAQWIEPTVELGEDAITSVRIERREGLLNEFNAVKVRFTSPAHQWQEQQAATVRDEAAVARLGREVVDETVLPMVFSHTQAQRLGKIELYEDNPEWVGEIGCHGAAALELIDQRVFRYRDADLDLDLVARITRLTIAKDLSSATIGFESITREAYEWDPETEEGPAPALPPDTSTDPLNPGPPTALSSITEDAGGGNVQAALRWSVPERAGQLFDLRYRETSSDPWIPQNGLTSPRFITPAVPAGTGSWEWEVRVRTSQGGVSTWAASTFSDEAFTATSLLAPTALAATGGQESLQVSATQSTSAEAWTLEFSAVADGAPASWVAPLTVQAFPASAASVSASSPAGNRDVYARARSPLGTLTSPVIGPVSVVVAEIPPGGPSGGGGNGDSSNSGGGAGGVPGSSTGGTGGSESGSSTGGLW